MEENDLTEAVDEMPVAEEAAEPAAEAAGDEALRAMVEAAVEARVAEAVAAAVAEAEERGRLRGRNEMAERHMAKPGMWEDPREEDSTPASTDYDGEFLQFMRPSVWED